MSQRLKATGHDWLAHVPEHWDVVPITAAFTPRNQPSSPDDVHLTPSQRHGVMPQSDYMALTGGRVVLNLTGADKMKHVEPGDVISHLRSFQGGLETSFVTGKVSQAYTVISPRTGTDSGYFRYLFKSDRYVQALRVTTNQLRDGQSIRMNELRRIPLPLPPYPEQVAIADFLDRETGQIDALIEKQHALIDRLRERRVEVVGRVMFGGGGSAVTPSDEWYRFVPPGWQEGKIKHFGTVTLGKMLQVSDSGDDVKAPYLRAANVQPYGVLKPQDRKEMWFSPRELARLSLRSGDVVVVEGGIGGYGRAAYVQSDLVGWGFQNSINRVRPHNGNEGRYLAHLLVLARHRGFIESYCSIVSMPHLTAEKLAAMPIAFPVAEVQREIADDLDRETAKIDALIAKAERFIELAHERRSALITAAVTGQIDVTTGAA